MHSLSRLRYAFFWAAAILPMAGLASTAVISDDAYTSTAFAKSKLGTRPTLAVSAKEATFLRFDLSALPANFPTDQVAKATLRLWLEKTVRSGALQLVTVDAAWQEATITNAAPPATGALVLGNITLATGQMKKYVSFDVTALAKEWISGQRANFGLALKSDALSGAAVFDSKENAATSHEPQLEIVLAGPEGKQGIQGIQGVQGIAGLNGTDGQPGPQGIPGLNGTNGTNGQQGLPGTPGLQGLQGIQGIPGLNGTDGIQGPPGPAGLPATLVSGGTAAFPLYDDKSADFTATDLGTSQIQFLKKNYGYLFFGLKGVAGHLFAYGADTGSGQNTLFQYNDANDTWDVKAFIAQAGTYPAWCEGNDNDSLYFFGGYSGTYQKTAKRYTISTGMTTTLAPMLVANSAAVAARVGNKIYVVGGTGIQGDDAKALQCFDLANPGWTRLLDCPAPPYSYGEFPATVVGTKIYYPFTYYSQGSLVYDTVANQWQFCDCVFTGDLLTIQGEVWSLKDSVRFDPVADRGTPLAGLPHAQVAGQVGGILYGFTSDSGDPGRFFKVPLSSLQRIWVKK